MSKDGAYRANSRDIQFPDGRKLETGSSYTGGKEESRNSRRVHIRAGALDSAEEFIGSCAN